MNEPIKNIQIPNSYNAENSESITWQEAIDQGYIEGGKTDESNTNSGNTSNE